MAPPIKRQISASFSAYGGNAQLDPEQSKRWEGGIEGLTGLMDWRLSAYHNDIDDNDRVGYRQRNILQHRQGVH